MTTKNEEILEIEVKLRMASIDRARALLARLPAVLSRERGFEDNVVYDLPDGSLRRQECMLRLRDSDGEGTLTWKEKVPTQLRAKVRAEVESKVASPEAVRTILGKLGLVVVYRYQKYRADYRWTDPDGGAQLLICLDDTPIGAFVELEGPPETIDRAASAMGCTAPGWTRRACRRAT
jgi:adenylate cyclase class 2